MVSLGGIENIKVSWQFSSGGRASPPDDHRALPLDVDFNFGRGTTEYGVPQMLILSLDEGLGRTGGPLDVDCNFQRETTRDYGVP